MVGMMVMPVVSECKLGVALAIAAAEQHNYGSALYRSIGTGLVVRQVVLKGVEIAALSATEDAALLTAAEFSLLFVPAAGTLIA